MDQPAESPIITLNPEKKSRLEQKLQEYRHRRIDYIDDGLDVVTPRHSHMISIETKIAVLETLLNDGKIETWELSRRLINEIQGYQADVFEAVCVVINGYNSGDQSGLYGGTGLPQ